MTVGTVLIAMVLGVLLALLLDRKFLGRGVVRTLLITPFLVMPVGAALLWKTTMFDPTFGIVNYIFRPFGIGKFVNDAAGAGRPAEPAQGHPGGGPL